jgi:hypothetical protein
MSVDGNNSESQTDRNHADDKRLADWPQVGGREHHGHPQASTHEERAPNATTGRIRATHKLQRARAKFGDVGEWVEGPPLVVWEEVGVRGRCRVVQARFARRGSTGREDDNGVWPSGRGRCLGSWIHGGDRLEFDVMFRNKYKHVQYKNCCIIIIIKYILRL